MSHLLWYPGHELTQRTIIRAENCSLLDAAGRRFVDLESGVWCTAVGHGHPRLRRVLSDQAARIAHTGFNYTAPIVEEAAAALLDLLRFEGGRCVFLCSGSEAVEYGVRVAQSILAAAGPARPILLTMADSYFGAYGAAHGRRDDAWTSFNWLEDGAPSARLRRLPWDRIGGFLFEPGSSSGFVRFPPEALIRDIVERVRAQGGLVLVNEVTTGVGRTGRWFGHEHYDIRPDVVALGKGIGNGYPVSATLFAPGVIERLGGVPGYAQSHQNDPLGAAIVLEVLRLIEEEGLIERGRELGRRLADGLEAIRRRTRGLRAIRARGLMVALDLEAEEAGDEVEFTLRIHRELAERGFLVGRRPGSATLRLDPALTIEWNDLERFLETFEAILGTRPTRG